MKNSLYLLSKAGLASLLLSPMAFSNPADSSVDEAESSEIKSIKREDIYITGGAEAIKKQPGSAHLIDEKELEKFDYDDINRVLSHVPGVNIQEEEGYGLRPNIGLRGAQPNRSRKLAIMEDGVLIGPAPYSAPAAYYFPIFAKMEGIEVFKGPSAIKYGPNTVGGAVNLVTRSIPEEDKGKLSLTYGTDQFSKAHVYYGQRYDNGGWLIDGINLQSDGFKDLDTGGNTGFNKSDVTVKGLINSDYDADVYQQLEIKLQYSDEDSNSTYTGLTEEDFNENPYRRYAASERDNFDAEHRQLMLSHYIEFSPTLSLTTLAYRNEFERVWTRLDRFATNTAPTLGELFADPNAGGNSVFIDILRGDLDSSVLGADGELLVLNNDREFVSQGIQFIGHWDPILAGLAHEFEFGLRYHNDYIERKHTSDVFAMTNGRLVSTGTPRQDEALNKDSTDAIAVHVQDKVEIGDLTLTAGLRTEFIDNTREDRSATNAPDIDRSDTVVIPGAGVFYQLTPELGLLAGVYKGFSPVGPGQDDDIDPEESVNYEAGFRYYDQSFSAEVIGFYNDYSNLLGVCAGSAGCASGNDTQFNAGEAEIYGAEISLGYQFVHDELAFPVSLDYTFTEAQFASTFESLNPDWGIGTVNDGDTIPYIPDHQLSLSAGIVGKSWASHVVFKHTGERTDTANEAVTPRNRTLESFEVVDFNSKYSFSQDLQVHASVKNLFDKEYVTSRRPFR